MATFLIVYKFLLCICYSMEEEKQYKKQPTKKKKKNAIFMLFTTLFILITFKIDLFFNPKDVVEDHK